MENMIMTNSGLSDSSRHRAYLGVGSNMGNRNKNILDAEKLINESGVSRIIQISKIYETEPYGYVDQDRFLNCAFEVETILSPKELMRQLLEIEAELKRERTIPLGPRTIDLDILFYDDVVTSSQEVIIPHPRLHERMFVLIPLCDIAPTYIHPVLKKPCRQIADELAGGSRES